MHGSAPIRQRPLERRGRFGRSGSGLRPAQAPAHAVDQPVWFFDLDNTLHDAGRSIFPRMNAAMSAYIQHTLKRSLDEADRLRRDYWVRYGSTLQGLLRHHSPTVKAHDFLARTHHFPALEAEVVAHAHDVQVLRRLPGRKVLLTNAQGEYARRVLRGLGLLRCFDRIIPIEDMRMFGHWRPKPDARLFRALVARLKVRPSRCILVEDTLEHQKAAHAQGWQTVWMQRWLLGAGRDRPGASARLSRKPAYTRWRARRLEVLLRCTPLSGPRRL